jgi:hypothetical protein
MTDKIRITNQQSRKEIEDILESIGVEPVDYSKVVHYRYSGGDWYTNNSNDFQTHIPFLSSGTICSHDKMVIYWAIRSIFEFLADGNELSRKAAKAVNTILEKLELPFDSALTVWTPTDARSYHPHRSVVPDNSLEPIVVLMVNPYERISIVVSKWNSSL